MKKVLLSLVAIAVATASFAQNARTSVANPTNGENSQNLVNVDGNKFTFSFMGTAADNCVGTAASPAVFPVTSNSGLMDLYGGITQTDLAIANVGGGKITYTIKAGTPVGTNIRLRFLDPMCGFSSQVVDLSDVANQAYEFDYTSSAKLDVAIFIMGNMTGGSAGNPFFGDKNVAKQTFNAGTGVLVGVIQDSTGAGAKANVNTAGAFEIQLQESPTTDVTLSFTKIIFGLPTATAIVDPTFATSKSLVFPNPVSSNEALTVSNTKGDVSMKLLNSTGSIVTSVEGSTLQLNNVNAGLYFLEVSANGTVKTEKIIVR